MTESPVERLARAERAAEMLTVVARLAHASQCPADANVMAWCLQHGLVELGDDGEYRLTAKSRTRAIVP